MKFQQDSQPFEEILSSKSVTQVTKAVSQYKAAARAAQKTGFKTDFRMSKERWVASRCKIMMVGLLAKVTQNPNILQTLLSTTGKCLIHCSPHQRWGDGELGTGLNWVGHALASLREFLQRNSGYVWDGTDPSPKIPELPKLRTSTPRRRNRQGASGTQHTGKDFKPGSVKLSQEEAGQGEQSFGCKPSDGLADGFLICSDCRVRTATRQDRSDGLFYCFPCWEDFYGAQDTLSDVDRILSYFPTEHFEVLELEWMLDEDDRLVSGECGVLLSQARAAFKRLSLLVHPDKNNDPNAAEAFSRLSTALDHVTNQINGEA